MRLLQAVENKAAIESAAKAKHHESVTESGNHLHYLILYKDNHNLNMVNLIKKISGRPHSGVETLLRPNRVERRARTVNLKMLRKN